MLTLLTVHQNTTVHQKIQRKSKRNVKKENSDLQDLESKAEGMIPLSAYKLPQGLNSRN